MKLNQDQTILIDEGMDTPAHKKDMTQSPKRSRIVLVKRFKDDARTVIDENIYNSIDFMKTPDPTRNID